MEPTPFCSGVAGTPATPASDRCMNEEQPEEIEEEKSCGGATLPSATNEIQVGFIPSRRMEEETCSSNKAAYFSTNNDESTGAQKPYFTRQKQPKKCCEQSMSQLNDVCKYMSFLNSNQLETELEALKYFEMNIKLYSSEEVLRLFNHGFIDCLLDKVNTDKLNDTTQFVFKIIFLIVKKQCGTFKHNGKNLFFEKLISRKFEAQIQKYCVLLQQQKKNCLVAYLTELKQSFKCYQYFQSECPSNEPQQNVCKQYAQTSKSEEVTQESSMGSSTATTEQSNFVTNSTLPALNSSNKNKNQRFCFFSSFLK